MTYYKLNNGVQIPIMGSGVWQIEDHDQCVDVVTYAIKIGCRLIDTATVYKNEAAVGEAVRKCGVPREELFITSKLWVQDMGYEATKAAIDRLLARMGLEYLDLYLIHHSLGDYQGSWKAMEEACRAGKIRAIGVSNFGINQLKTLMTNAEIVPAVNQIEFHPLCQQKELRSFMEKNHIQLEAWSPLGSGNKELLTDPVLTAIAEKYGKNVGQVILRWHVQEHSIALPRSTKKERILSNSQLWDFELTEDEMNAIRAMDTGKNVLGYDPDAPGQWGEFIRNLKVES